MPDIDTIETDMYALTTAVQQHKSANGQLGRPTGRPPELAAPYGRPKPPAAPAPAPEPLRERAASVAQAVEDLELQVKTTQRHNDELRAKIEAANGAINQLRIDAQRYQDQAEAANERAEKERMRRVRLQTILATVGNNISDGLNEDVDD